MKFIKNKENKRARQASIDAYENEGGASGKKASQKWPMGVDPSDSTTAKQFNQARESRRR